MGALRAEIRTFKVPSLGKLNLKKSTEIFVLTLALTASESCFALLCLAALEAICVHCIAQLVQLILTLSKIRKETSQTELLLHMQTNYICNSNYILINIYLEFKFNLEF